MTLSFLIQMIAYHLNVGYILSNNSKFWRYCWLQYIDYTINIMKHAESNCKFNVLYCEENIIYIIRKTWNIKHLPHRPENRADSFPTTNVNSSSNGLSWTGGPPPVARFLFSLTKKYFFMSLNFSWTWSGVRRQTPQLLTFPAMSCHSWPFSWLVTSPVKALWITTLFVATSSRSTVISWCV